MANGVKPNDDTKLGRLPRTSRDRDVVKMARMILAHLPDGPHEVAHALLKSAAKQRG
jgi:hypothetical protein